MSTKTPPLAGLDSTQLADLAEDIGAELLHHRPKLDYKRQMSGCACASWHNGHPILDSHALESHRAHVIVRLLAEGK